MKQIKQLNIIISIIFYYFLINFKYNNDNKIDVNFRGSSKEKLADFVEILKTKYIRYIAKI